MNRATEIAALVLIVVCVGARFVALETSPPGFFIDEAAGAVNTICLATEGTGESGVSFPFFFPQFGAFFTPVYVYFGAAWINVFGASIGSFRAIAAFFTLLAILGLGAVALRLMGRRGALFAMLAAAVSPWSFQFSRIAWDPPLMPCFLLWGIYFLIAAEKRARWLVASGVLLSLAAYSYPPARVQIPLLLAPVLWLLASRKAIDLKRFAVWCVALVVPSIPLAVLTLNGTLQSRFQLLSVFNSHYGKPGLDGVGLLIENFGKHLSPGFLFVTGDKNLRHSAQLAGELSWLDAYAWALGLLGIAWFIYERKRGEKISGSKTAAIDVRMLAVLVGAGIFGGLLPAALTWESVPHSLRALGAWPFFALLSGWLIERAVSVDAKVGLSAVGIAAVFAFRFGTSYYGYYPEHSKLWFDTVFKDTALHGQRTGDWKPFAMASREYADVSARYYLIRYGGETCSSSRERIRSLKTGL